MIEFHYETAFSLPNEIEISRWISSIITMHNFEEGEILYVFCDDDFLHKLNLNYLKHDTFTDILSFDYGLGKKIEGEIYISIDRVTENSKTFNASFSEELNRVMIHGILHFMGYKDSSENEKAIMRGMEERALLERDFS